MRTLDIGILLPKGKKVLTGAPLSETEIPIIVSRHSKHLNMFTTEEGYVEIQNPLDKTVAYAVIVTYDNYQEILKDAFSKVTMTVFDLWRANNKK